MGLILLIALSLLATDYQLRPFQIRVGDQTALGWELAGCAKSVEVGWCDGDGCYTIGEPATGCCSLTWTRTVSDGCLTGFARVALESGEVVEVRKVNCTVQEVVSVSQDH